MSVRTTRGGWKLLLSAPLLLAGCYEGLGPNRGGGGLDDDGNETVGPGGPEGGADLVGPGECEDTKEYFETEVWGPILSATCFACHNPNGAAKDTDFVLQGNDYPGYIEANYNTVQNISRLEIEGTSLLLLKPSLQVEHTGGKVMPKKSDQYDTMKEMVRRLQSEIHCEDDGDIKEYFTGIVESDEEQTLRKGTFLLASRLPTPEEYDMVRGEGMTAVEAVLDNVLQEDAFYTRVGEIFNDMLHTNAYLQGADALNALDPDRFPDAHFYEDAPEEDQDELMNLANDAVAREPLNIIDFIVRNDESFKKVLTANWTVLTPYSSRAYGGIGQGRFDDYNDPNELVQWTHEDIPHAGILTTPVFLARYPSTDTNRNRHRSRVVYKFFLATDVMRLAARPVDIASVAAFNPTLYENQCNICHDNVDPLAGAFQNWTNEGWYRPPESGWHPDMRPPGFGELQIPFEETETALPWLANHLVDDPKFSLAVVHAIYSGLTGQEPLVEPLGADNPFYVQQIRAFEAQDWSFKKVAKRFEDSGYNIKEVFKGLVVSPWFRAVNLDFRPDKKRAAELAPMGTARLLPPEGLHRKLAATVGFGWNRNENDLLLQDYRFFYGGIDSANVTTRLTEMNGVMVNIAERMANEMGCYATGNDFARPQVERLLFPEVEPTDTPDTAKDKIKANIRYLHLHLLGENLQDGDPELERTYQLFESIWADGYDGANPPEGEPAQYSVQLPGACQAINDRATGDALPADQQIVDDPDYTVRAWMAVITFLLGDYEFLYE